MAKRRTITIEVRPPFVHRHPWGGWAVSDQWSSVFGFRTRHKARDYKKNHFMASHELLCAIKGAR